MSTEFKFTAPATAAAAVHRVNEPAFLERLDIYPVVVITAGLDGDLSLAEARFLCERMVTESLPELERKVNHVLWPGPMPAAKAPVRPGGAPDRAGGP